MKSNDNDNANNEKMPWKRRIAETEYRRFLIAYVNLTAPLVPETVAKEARQMIALIDSLTDTNNEQ